MADLQKTIENAWENRTSLSPAAAPASTADTMPSTRDIQRQSLEQLVKLSIECTAAERRIINRHVEVSIRMLEALPWPRHLKNVPEFAGGHHERMDGKGYPRGLKREEMSVQARIMGIADIFEALTAKDRPYKSGKTLTESLNILGLMKLNGHIDPDLFDIFIRERVYESYAKEFMDPKQIDAVDVKKIPASICFGSMNSFA